NSALSYAWSFPGADITSFTDKDPPAITYSTPGTYIITLAVTNECGTTTATRSITVTAPPNVNPISNISLCKGSGSPPISFGNAANNNSVNYKWTNSNPLIGLTSSGTGRSLPSFTAQNNTPNPITAVITVVPVLNGCDGTPISFEITVNPATPAADAGVDRKLCSASTIQLAASDPGPWQGRWTLTSGQSGISFDDDTKANAV